MDEMVMIPRDALISLRNAAMVFESERAAKDKLAEAIKLAEASLRTDHVSFGCSLCKVEAGSAGVFATFLITRNTEEASPRLVRFYGSEFRRQLLACVGRDLEGDC